MADALGMICWTRAHGRAATVQPNVQAAAQVASRELDLVHSGVVEAGVVGLVYKEYIW